MRKTPRAVALALVSLVAAPAVAHADGPARLHWRGLHNNWLTHHGPRSIPAGDGAGWVTFDAATGTLYVANGVANTISVIDAARCARRCDGPVATLPTGHTPASTAINGRTLYAPNLDDGTLSVYDIAACNARVTSGCRPAVATMQIGGIPLGVTIDAASNSVYVGNAVVDSLAIVDGATCNRAVTSGCAVAGQAATAPGPAFPFTDPATRTIYSPDNGPDAEAGGNSVSVIDARACNARVLTGCAPPAATIPVGAGPASGGVDPLTGTVYVTNQADNTVSVIDAARCNGRVVSGCAATPPTTAVAPEPNSGVAVDQASHTLYVVGSAQDVLSVVDTSRCRAGNTSGCGETWRTLQTGDLPFWLDFDQRSRTLYTANFIGDDVSALDAAGCNAFRTDSCRDNAPVIVRGAEDQNLAIDHAVHTLYGAQGNLHKLTMVDSDRRRASRPDRCTGHTEPVPGVSGPFDLVVDEGTKTLYATNQDDHSVVLIDPSTCNVSRSGGCAPVGPAIPIPGRPFMMALDPGSHALYVAGFEGNLLYRIDGAHCRIGDRSRCAPISGPVGEMPLDVDLDLATQTAYTTNGSGTVSVVDTTHCCAAKATITVAPNMQQAAFDPGTRTLYVAVTGNDTPGRVAVIDTRACNGRVTSACGQTPKWLATGRGPLGITVDPATHAVYTTDILHATVSVLDGRTCNALRSDGCDRAPRQFATSFFPLDPLLDGSTLYVSSGFDQTIQVLPVG